MKEARGWIVFISISVLVGMVFFFKDYSDRTNKINKMLFEELQQRR
jgi:hypothetical protein